MKSKDYDGLYAHGQTHHLADMARSAARGGPGDLIDEEQLTFGSRPPTAPEKKQRDEEMEMQTPSVNLADNSMVHIGQITVDRKNHLLGNRFQDPSLNQHDQSSTSEDIANESKKNPSQFKGDLEFDERQAEQEERESLLK